MKSRLRNQRAYQTVMSWRDDHLTDIADLAQGYPIELRTSGTMQTLAFSIGKADKAHTAMADAIADWVLSPQSGGPVGELPSARDRSAPKLLQLLATANGPAYVAADTEAIAFADAIKTIAKAIARSGR